MNQFNETRNYDVLESSNGGLIKAWTKGVAFEEQAQGQLRKIAELPFIHRWVAAMPDVHTGIGATVGSVIPTKGAIIPAAVGVDIGCGMIARKTTLKAKDLPENLAFIRSEIEAAVPVGESCHKNITPELEAVWMGLNSGYEQIMAENPGIRDSKKIRQLGTLGGGNHFIEICLDEEQSVWVVLHSGSRGVGSRIGYYFIELAKKDMQKWFLNLPNKDLAYFPEGTEHFEKYVTAVHWAQEYARLNRELMMQNVLEVLRGANGIPPFTVEAMAVNCHHNYVAIENHYGENVFVTRKGALRAREGDLGIIPGSMGAKSYIVRGKGNPESFHSCSHGAGRMMSRTKAKEVISLEDHAKATQGVECRKDKNVLDESPRAYKDIDSVMEAQKDLVDILHTLKQIVCVKG